MIMASQAYRDGGAIILWWDEAESDGDPGDNADDFNHTIGEIVISDLAHANEGGLPYGSMVNMTHSSDLKRCRKSSTWVRSWAMLQLPEPTICPICLNPA